MTPDPWNEHRQKKWTSGLTSPQGSLPRRKVIKMKNNSKHYMQPSSLRDKLIEFYPEIDYIEEGKREKAELREKRDRILKKLKAKIGFSELDDSERKFIQG